MKKTFLLLIASLILVSCGGGGGGSDGGSGGGTTPTTSETLTPTPTPTPSTYTISGKVILSGAGLSGVTVSLTGASTTTTTTNVNGDYAFAGALNGSYTVTPSLTGYTFSPASKSVTVSGANLIGQDFTATRTNSNEITIKASFTGINAKSTWLNRIYAWFVPKAYALNSSLVARVLVFSAGDNSYTSANVTNGTFSINVKKGSPAGMIFVGSNNTYLGYLTLKNGIESLPMQMLPDNVASIDLGVLSSSGLIVEPSHNPIGNEIPLNDAEMKAIAQSNALFASVIKNSDFDNNGVIDILEGKFFSILIQLGWHPGRFGSNLTPILESNPTINGTRINMLITEPGSPSFIADPLFYGPAGSGLENGKPFDGDANRPSIIKQDANSYTASFSWPFIPGLPPEGQYSVKYNENRTISFNVSDLSQAPDSLVMTVPTVVLNNDGTMNKITWSFSIKSSSEKVNPATVIKNNFGIQIPGSGPICASNHGVNSTIMYQTGLSITDTEHTFTCQNLPWANISRIGFYYNDYYDNHYYVDFLIQ
jgi:hypothetical protein